MSDSEQTRRSRAITVRTTPQQAYAAWRDFENLPRFMTHLESVQDLGGGRSRWKAKGPADKTIEWEAELTEDVPGDRISWRSVEGSDVEHAGTVWFRTAPGDRGTEVHVVLEYDPPGGRLGSALAKLTRKEPGQQLYDDLRAFKQIIEIGEVMVSDGSLRPRDPAQPEDEDEDEETHTRVRSVEETPTQELR